MIPKLNIHITVARPPPTTPIPTTMSSSSQQQQQQAAVVPPQLEDIDCAEDDGVFIDEAELGEAQQKIKQWMNLNDEIAKLSAAIRERRKQKKALDGAILTFMEANKIPHFELSRGKLSLAVSKRKQSFNPKWVMEKLGSLKLLESETHRDEVQAALQDRPVTEVARLKHSKARGT